MLTHLLGISSLFLDAPDFSWNGSADFWICFELVFGRFDFEPAELRMRGSALVIIIRTNNTIVHLSVPRA